LTAYLIVAEQAAVANAQRLLALFRADEERLTNLGRSGPSVRQGYAALRQRPLTSTKQLKERSSLSFPTPDCPTTIWLRGALHQAFVTRLD
jgi:hypothetical protein